jgi:hypothetical protein
VQTEHSTLHFELTERDHDGVGLVAATELLELVVEALGAEPVRGELEEVAQELRMTEAEPEAAQVEFAMKEPGLGNAQLVDRLVQELAEVLGLELEVR